MTTTEAPGPASRPEHPQPPARLTIRRLRVIASAVVLSIAGLLALGASTYSYVNRDRLFPFQDTIVVYGTEACSITQRVRSELAARHIDYVFADADVPAISDELWAKIGRSRVPQWITFPVVHVAGRMLHTPSPDEIVAARDAYLRGLGSAAPARDYATFLHGGELVQPY